MKLKVSKFFMQFTIAGFTYYDGVEVFNKLEIGQKLKLRIEPENRYDPEAVAVYFYDKQLGYVPKAQNKTLFQFIALGYDIFECYINSISRYEHPEKQISVLVRIKKNKNGKTKNKK